MTGIGIFSTLLLPGRRARELDCRKLTVQVDLELFTPNNPKTLDRIGATKPSLIKWNDLQISDTCIYYVTELQ